MALGSAERHADDFLLGTNDRARRPDVVLATGDHVFAAPGEVHEGCAEEDTTFLVIAPGGVVPSSR